MNIIGNLELTEDGYFDPTVQASVIIMYNILYVIPKSEQVNINLI